MASAAAATSPATGSPVSRLTATAKASTAAAVGFFGAGPPHDPGQPGLFLWADVCPYRQTRHGTGLAVAANGFADLGLIGGHVFHLRNTSKIVARHTSFAHKRHSKTRPLSSVVILKVRSMV
jgi:hypothetical protein